MTPFYRGPERLMPRRQASKALVADQAPSRRVTSREAASAEGRPTNMEPSAGADWPRRNALPACRQQHHQLSI